MLQFHRVERYLHRIRRIYAGIPHVYKSTKYYEDDIRSFFIHCHHLCDWITQEYPGLVTKHQVDAFINQHEALRVCADLCNSSKHCKIQKVRNGNLPSMAVHDGYIVTYLESMKKPITFFGKYRIIAGRDSFDALELAETAFKLWRDFNHRLALKRI